MNKKFKSNRPKSREEEGLTPFAASFRKQAPRFQEDLQDLISSYSTPDDSDVFLNLISPRKSTFKKKQFLPQISNPSLHSQNSGNFIFSPAHHNQQFNNQRSDLNHEYERSLDNHQGSNYNQRSDLNHDYERSLDNHQGSNYNQRSDINKKQESNYNQRSDFNNHQASSNNYNQRSNNQNQSAFSPTSQPRLIKPKLIQNDPQQGARTSTGILPDKYRSIFPFSHFNNVQSACIQTVLNSDANIVVSAPTGSGKTGILELAIVRLLQQGSHDFKIVYIAPTKALCSERCKDWKNKFRLLGITCNELTGIFYSSR